ncbi:MAG TPA: plasmid pRiA4b ORF-3 family protein [Acidimicrobiales bacterium]|nr:plasmid pRiA4b ORF-3 family protein [Acidimicrobiales bacterium]
MVAQPRRLSDATTIQLRVSLLGPEPTIWRRLQVPGEVRLSKFHAILQAAMGWENSHLHSFEVAGQSYEAPDEEVDDEDDAVVDEDSVMLADLVEVGMSFSYVYDFGDGWNHEIVVESMEPVPQTLNVAVCLEGQGACPPEDCGGVDGFAQLVEAISDPDHDEHQEYRDWVGGSFDPAGFDLAAVNAALQRVR